MGLIKAAIGAIGSTLADQWKEYICCDAIDADTLVVKGYKKVSGKSSNKFGSDNIITDGSAISVADGQCMIIVEQGRVVELSAEPGVFVYNNKTEPSIFGGDFYEGLIKTFETMKTRFVYGGQAYGDQRVYYFNTKEILGNKYGTATPIPFRVVDNNIGLDVDISIRCNGEYSYRIINPILFYANVCGNISADYTRGNIDSMLKTELLTALNPTFAKISEQGIRYSALPAHTTEIASALNQTLSEKWRDLRGLEIASFGVNSVSASKEDEDMIKQLQRTAVMRNPNMAAATLVGAQADAMRDAANNSGGAFVGFAGMNMAQANGGMNAQSLFNMGQQQAPTPTAPKAEENSWNCSCGMANTGKFCMECGTPKPSDNSWTCGCGNINKGKFCIECGNPKPSGFKCDKCGWVPSDPQNPPKFCPTCGDSFTDEDKV